MTSLCKKVILTGFLSGVCINPSFSHSKETISPVGSSVPATKANKLIKVIALDTMRFSFSEKPKLHDGEIITFEITNAGKVTHEFSIGDEQEQKAHQEMMRAMPNMVHEDGNTMTLKPGETKTLTWKFKSAPGHEVVFSCNIPGHYEAGMYQKVKVAAS